MNNERNDKSWDDFTGNISELYKKAKGKSNNAFDIKNMTKSIYKNDLIVAQIEILQYILFLVLLYYYNPMSISTHYTAITNVLVLL